MQASSNPEYLRATAEAVDDFRRAFEDFLQLHVIAEGVDSIAPGIAPAVSPRRGTDPAQIAQRRAAVSRAAGRACAAAPLTGMSVQVQGHGVVDPIAVWETVARPKPLLEPRDILDACGQILGRLEAMALRAAAEAPPTTGVEAMHPLVWGAARRLWHDRHYREAVAAAAEAVVGNVRAVTGRNDVAETALWQEIFSERLPAAGRPRLRWPGEADDRAVKTMNDGLRQFAPGAQMTVRNPAAHGTGRLDVQEALEQLAVLSLLARWVERCELHRFADGPPDGP